MEECWKYGKKKARLIALLFLCRFVTFIVYMLRGIIKVGVGEIAYKQIIFCLMDSYKLNAK